MSSAPISADLARPSLSARRHVGRRRRQFRALLGMRRAGRAVPLRSRRPARAAAHRAAGAHRPRLALLPAGSAPGHALRLPRARPVSPGEGHRFNAHKLLLDPYAQADRRPLQLERRACSATRWATARRDLSFDRRDSARGMPKCRVVDPAFTWGDDRPPAVPWTTRSSTSCTCAASPAAPGRSPALRGTYAGLATAPVIDYLKRSRRHDGRAAAGPRLRRRPPPASKRACATTGATTRIGFFAPDDALFGVAARSTSSRRWSRRCTRQASRSSSTSSTTTPPKATSSARRCRFRGIDNAAYYRLAEDRALLRRLHRLRQHAQHAASARAADGHGLAALLGHRDARRRLPLRPRVDAGARARTRSTRSAASSTSSARTRCSHGSSSSPSRGTSARRLPGRQLSAGLGGMERPLPRHHARVLEGRRRPRRRSSRSG